MRLGDFLERARPIAGKQIAQGQVAVVADRLVEARKIPAQLADLDDLVDAEFRHSGDLLVGRLTRELGAQLAFDLPDLHLPLRDMNRKPDGPARVLQPALDGLADPQGAVGRELEATAPVELLDGADQPKHALLDEILERQPMALVPAGLRDHEAKVCVDHPVLGDEIATLDPLREFDLLGGGQKRVLAGLSEEQVERVQRALAGPYLIPATGVAVGTGQVCATPLPTVRRVLRPAPGATGVLVFATKASFGFGGIQRYSIDFVGSMMIVVSTISTALAYMSTRSLGPPITHLPSASTITQTSVPTATPSPTPMQTAASKGSNQIYPVAGQGLDFTTWNRLSDDWSVSPTEMHSNGGDRGTTPTILAPVQLQAHDYKFVSKIQALWGTTCFSLVAGGSISNGQWNGYKGSVCVTDNWVTVARIEYGATAIDSRQFNPGNGVYTYTLAVKSDTITFSAVDESNQQAFSFSVQDNRVSVGGQVGFEAYACGISITSAEVLGN